MAGSIAKQSADMGNGYTKYTIVWTSTSGGAVSGNPVSVRRGYLAKVKFIPAAGGTQPTDLYDVTVTDTDGVDVLNGCGANLSNAAAAAFVPLFGDGTNKSQRILLEDGDLTPVVANAGNAKSGTIILIIGP